MKIYEVLAIDFDEVSWEKKIIKIWKALNLMEK
jgi:hypothetical protein